MPPFFGGTNDYRKKSWYLVPVFYLSSLEDLHRGTSHPFESQGPEPRDHRPGLPSDGGGRRGAAGPVGGIPAAHPGAIGGGVPSETRSREPQGRGKPGGFKGIRRSHLGIRILEKPSEWRINSCSLLFSAKTVSLGRATSRPDFAAPALTWKLKR